jgi:putative membrane protein
MNMKKTLRLVFLTPILTLVAWLPFDVALAQTGGYSRWGMGMGSGMMSHWGFGWFGGISMIILWILLLTVLVSFIIWLAHSGSRYHTAGNVTDHALTILRERYARGEIEKEEFESRKKDLTR